MSLFLGFNHPEGHLAGLLLLLLLLLPLMAKQTNHFKQSLQLHAHFIVLLAVFVGCLVGYFYALCFIARVDRQTAICTLRRATPTAVVCFMTMLRILRCQ